jgi:hypothetical protein
MASPDAYIDWVELAELVKGIVCEPGEDTRRYSAATRPEPSLRDAMLVKLEPADKPPFCNSYARPTSISLALLVVKEQDWALPATTLPPT